VKNKNMEQGLHETISDYFPFTGVYAYGFERPSAIQQRAIMPVIKGKESLQYLPISRQLEIS